MRHNGVSSVSPKFQRTLPPAMDPDHYSESPSRWLGDCLEDCSVKNPIRKLGHLQLQNKDISRIACCLPQLQRNLPALALTPDHPPRCSIAPSDLNRSPRAALPNGHGAKGARLKTRRSPRADTIRSCRCPKTPLGQPNRCQDYRCYHSERQFCKKLNWISVVGLGGWTRNASTVTQGTESRKWQNKS